MGGKTVSVFANWFSWTGRPHHLVNYINSVDVRADVFAMRTVRSRGPALRSPNHLTSAFLYPRPFTCVPRVRDWNAGKKQSVLNRFFDSESDCHIFASEPVLPTRKRQDCIRIYDCEDDWASFPWVGVADRKVIEHYERSLGEWADKIWVVSRKLEEKLRPLFGRTVEYVPNGVDYDHFRSVPQLRPVVPRSQPRVGYIGAIHNWLDTALVRGVADKLKDWEIVLVGPNYLSSQELSLLDATNIRHVGRVAYDRLPEVMAIFDVAMIPFKLSPLIEATSPIKLYEYLAAGLPVVSTPMPEVVPFGESGVVICRETVEGFAEAVRDLRTSARPIRCQEIAKEQSWRARFEKPLANVVRPRCLVS